MSGSSSSASTTRKSTGSFATATESVNPLYCFSRKFLFLDRTGTVTLFTVPLSLVGEIKNPFKN